MRRVALLMLVLSVMVPAVSAQQAEPPLVVRLYTGELALVHDAGEVVPLEACAPTGDDTYSGFPIVYAPDASRFAFLALTDMRTKSRIYICDVANTALIPVVGQEAAKIRSMPAWSPDGAQIAWNQVEEDGSGLETVVYDIASETQQIVYERTESSFAYVVPDVAWGQSGLAIHDVIRQETGPVQASVTFIDPAAAEAETLPVALDETAQLVGRWAWHGDTERYVLSVKGSQITVIDAQTQVIDTLSGRLELYSLSAEESIGLVQTQNAWAVYGPDFSGSLDLYQGEYSVTIAPDGQRLAFVTFENYPWGGKAYIMDNFEGFPYQATPIPGLDSAGYSEEGVLYVFWGPVGLRIQDQ